MLGTWRTHVTCAGLVSALRYRPCEVETPEGSRVSRGGSSEEEERTRLQCSMRAGSRLVTGAHGPRSARPPVAKKPNGGPTTRLSMAASSPSPASIPPSAVPVPSALRELAETVQSPWQSHRGVQESPVDQSAAANEPASALTRCDQVLYRENRASPRAGAPKHRTHKMDLSHYCTALLLLCVLHRCVFCTQFTVY